MKKVLLGLVILLVFAVTAGGIWLMRVNRFQVEGEMNLSILDAPVEVIRDENGIPSIFAQNTPDLLRAQGFITAQHRLFRMEMFKYLLNGRFAEIMGEGFLDSDILFRTIWLKRNAEQHFSKLSPESRAFFTHYVEGVNAYIENYKEEHPFELSAIGLEPTPWTELDALNIMYFASFTQSRNFRTEIIAQNLIDVLGLERAQEIMPVNIGADRAIRPRIDAVLAITSKGDQDEGATIESVKMPAWVGLDEDALPVDSNFENFLNIGSNNWAVAPGKSASGSAMVSNDPHVDARMLPGMWHPVGLFSPEIRAIGGSIPGVPGLWMGRTAHVAFGITNAYGDVQDLYIETVDPEDGNRYLEGETSHAFQVRQETIKIKDKNAPDGYRDHMIEIRSTRRGPVITGLLPGVVSPHVMTLRWAQAEKVGSEIGLNKLLTVHTVAEFDAAVQLIDVIMLNWVFADRSGGIGRRASGLVPKRASGDGTAPYTVTSEADNWIGYIPKDEMPGMIDPERGWVGTANHDTRPDGYDYYYSSYFS
ncbi:MAG: penicillin acylase family protein, partial [Deltaproteobacteria bacterium]|nr:penicillin acylase family protein [Deltaproteobacteria bacterium]